jgi:hypothetical protein
MGLGPFPELPPLRPTSAPEPSPPASGRTPGHPVNMPPPRPADAPVALGLGDRRVHTALPVGVRDGDVLIIGVDEALTDPEIDHMAGVLREAFGVQIKIVVIPAHAGVTVLRPERSA